METTLRTLSTESEIVAKTFLLTREVLTDGTTVYLLLEQKDLDTGAVKVEPLREICPVARWTESLVGA